MYRPLFAVLLLASCAPKAKQPAVAKAETPASGVAAARAKTDSIDPAYAFPDSLQRVRVLVCGSPDSGFEYTTIIHERRNGGQWKTVNRFDSIVTWTSGFSPDHKDFNGDGWPDFVFLAGNGARGANYFQHLLVYDTAKKTFTRIHGFDEVCAPEYDARKRRIIGTGIGGGYTNIGFYRLKGDTVLQTDGEVWEDGVLIRKYRGSVERNRD